MQAQSAALPARHERRRGERGEARLKFLIVIAILATIAYVGYQFIPIAYQAYQFKDYMQQNVDKAAVTGQTADWVETQLKAVSKEYNVPPDAEVEAMQRDGRMEARVRFTRPISLVVYTYQYEFDNTVKSSSLFTPKTTP
ncbi:MAG TPA: hypothetical protein VF544_15930 [Pyrinomonadaceae bacterium]|jgi:hypothetical protein